MSISFGTSGATGTSGGFSFGGFGGSSLTTATTTATPATTTLSTTTSLGGGGGGGSSGLNTLTSLLNQNQQGSTTSSASTTTSTTKTITFKTLEENINNWMNDLDAQEKEFLDQACQLNALDRLMIENGEKIVDLNGEVDRLKNEQNKLEQELEFISGQQNYLEQSIKKLETGIEQMPPINKQYGDEEREQTCRLLLTIDNQLRTMSMDLIDIIKRLNATNVNLNDPAVQISKILNAHMDSLSYIEDNTAVIQSQVDQLSKTISDKFKDDDKSNKSSFFM